MFISNDVMILNTLFDKNRRAAPKHEYLAVAGIARSEARTRSVLEILSPRISGPPLELEVRPTRSIPSPHISPVPEA